MLAKLFNLCNYDYSSTFGWGGQGETKPPSVNGYFHYPKKDINLLSNSLKLLNYPKYQTKKKAKARAFLGFAFSRERRCLTKRSSGRWRRNKKLLREMVPELEAKLGKVADSVIAEELGTTRKSVSYRRRVLGIPASNNRERNTPPPPMGGWNRKQLPPEIINRLGTEPDYKLAAEIGVNKTTIADARRKLNIKPCSEQNPKQTGFNNGGFLMQWVKNDVCQE